jgi:hypothetical protein
MVLPGIGEFLQDVSWVVGPNTAKCRPQVQYAFCRKSQNCRTTATPQNCPFFFNTLTRQLKENKLRFQAQWLSNIPPAIPLQRLT